MPLFRPEAARGQDALHGEVSLVPPVGWQVLGGFLLATVVVAAVFMALAQYSKVTVANGIISGDKGVTRIAPPRAGTFDAVYVEEGQVVAAGAPLVRLSVETSTPQGDLQTQRERALAEQRSALADRMANTERGGQGRIASLQAQIAGDEVQAQRLREQVEQEKLLIRSAEEELAGVQTLAKQGYLTGSNLRQREEQVATRRQSLARLEQEEAATRARIGVSRADMARTVAETRAGVSELAGSRAEVAQAEAGEDVQKSLVLRAPLDGVVTAVTVHAGDPATPGVPAVTVLPKGTRIEAVLAVPTPAAGLLEPGQSVRVAVDAFPYQTYGALPGRVTTVSRTTVPLANRTDGAEAFMVRASVPASIMAYGAARPLRPGMAVTARIKTRPRSLLAWLFDPILAVRRR